MMAVSCVELTKCGSARRIPSQSTTEPFTKFVPFTVRVNPAGVHDGVVFDEVVEAESEVMVGGTIVNWIARMCRRPAPV